MCICIDINSLVPNALIETLQKYDKRDIAFSDLLIYGSAVIDVLSEQGKDAFLMLTQDSRDAFLQEYSDYFATYSDTGVTKFVLTQKATLAELSKKFRGSKAVPENIIAAFSNEKATNMLMH